MIFKMRSPTTAITILAFLLGLELIACQSDDFIHKQLLCALDRTPCDDTGRQIKAILPEIIQRKCRKCSESQRLYANTITKYIQDNHPQAWGALLQKYS